MQTKLKKIKLFFAVMIASVTVWCGVDCAVFGLRGVGVEVGGGFRREARAMEYYVSNSSEMQNQATNAQPGDVIIIEPGIYEDWGTIVFTADGTEASPIIYRASSQGDVTFTGTMLFYIKADWITIRDFDFVEVAKDTSPPAGVIYIRDSFNSRITYCRFYSCGVTPTNGMASIVPLAGTKNLRIDHCLFDGSIYGMIVFDVRQDEDWPKNIQIDHNILLKLLPLLLNLGGKGHLYPLA